MAYIGNIYSGYTNLTTFQGQYIGCCTGQMEDVVSVFSSAISNTSRYYNTLANIGSMKESEFKKMMVMIFLSDFSVLLDYFVHQDMPELVQEDDETDNEFATRKAKVEQELKDTIKKNKEQKLKEITAMLDCVKKNSCVTQKLPDVWAAPDSVSDSRINGGFLNEEYRPDINIINPNAVFVYKYRVIFDLVEMDEGTGLVKTGKVKIEKGIIDEHGQFVVDSDAEIKYNDGIYNAGEYVRLTYEKTPGYEWKYDFDYFDLPGRTSPYVSLVDSNENTIVHLKEFGRIKLLTNIDDINNNPNQFLYQINSGQGWPTNWEFYDPINYVIPYYEDQTDPGWLRMLKNTEIRFIWNNGNYKFLGWKINNEESELISDLRLGTTFDDEKIIYAIIWQKILLYFKAVWVDDSDPNNPIEYKIGSVKAFLDFGNNEYDFQTVYEDAPQLVKYVEKPSFIRVKWTSDSSWEYNITGWSEIIINGGSEEIGESDGRTNSARNFSTIPGDLKYQINLERRAKFKFLLENGINGIWGYLERDENNNLIEPSSANQIQNDVFIDVPYKSRIGYKFQSVSEDYPIGRGYRCIVLNDNGEQEIHVSRSAWLEPSEELAFDQTRSLSGYDSIIQKKIFIPIATVNDNERITVTLISASDYYRDFEQVVTIYKYEKDFVRYNHNYETDIRREIPESDISEYETIEETHTLPARVGRQGRSDISYRRVSNIITGSNADRKYFLYEPIIIDFTIPQDVDCNCKVYTDLQYTNLYDKVAVDGKNYRIFVLNPKLRETFYLKFNTIV